MIAELEKYIIAKTATSESRLPTEIVFISSVSRAILSTAAATYAKASSDAEPDKNAEPASS